MSSRKKDEKPRESKLAHATARTLGIAFGLSVIAAVVSSFLRRGK